MCWCIFFVYNGGGLDLVTEMVCFAFCKEMWNVCVCVCGRGRPCNLEIRARLIQGYAMLRKTGGAVGEVG